MINKIYDVNHSRKGKFRIFVLDDSDKEWLTGIIVDGNPTIVSKTISDYEKGDQITVRKSFCTFTEVEK